MLTAEQTTTAVECPKPGVYFGISFENYVKWPALNFHSLMHYERSPMQARHAMMAGDKESDAKDFGSLVHTLALTPEKFDSSYAVAPDFSQGGTLHPNSKAHREAKAAWYEANRDKVTASHQDIADAKRAVSMLKAHQLTNEVLFGSKGRNEVSFVWEQRGRLCKGRVDRLCVWRGENWIVDLKTTRSVWIGAFDREAGKLLYHSQLGTYQHALSTLKPAVRRCGIAAIQNEEPFEPGWFTFDDSDLERGARRFDGWLAKHIECEKSGKWAPQNMAGMTIVLPKWIDQGYEGMED